MADKEMLVNKRHLDVGSSLLAEKDNCFIFNILN